MTKKNTELQEMQEHLLEVLEGFQAKAQDLGISLEQGPDGSIRSRQAGGEQRIFVDPQGLEERAKREGFTIVRGDDGEILALVGQSTPASLEESNDD